jgi:hypothetical protein
VKIGRNAPCPCNSGKKFKHCHGGLAPTPRRGPSNAEIQKALESHRSRERIRTAQQGLGRPIISANFAGHQVVAVRNRLHASPGWKAFSDFLADYLKIKLDPAWGNTEIAKPLLDRHPIMQWYDALCRQQAADGLPKGVLRSTPLTGVMACYYGVAYGLYLLDHNVELQERMLKRLKDPGQFQGAYYELMIANALIRAGFELTLEDETDGDTKHCEFAAVSKATGKKYWIEAKMRAVVGQLGRTAADGTTRPNPISHMIPHLNGALAKPAADERMIFIDLNTEMATVTDTSQPPPFVARATTRLERYEQAELQAGQAAYVFITNLNFHRSLDGLPQVAAFPFGLGYPDFNRPGFYRLAERYEQDQKHRDALRVMDDGLGNLLKFPSTFDGSLPSVALMGERPPIIIGQGYEFQGAGPNGEDLRGVVADAVVMEPEKSVMVAVSCDDGTSRLLTEPMSDAQLADYRAHQDAYFGKVVRPSKMISKPMDLFDFFMDSYATLSREELLKRIGGRLEGADDLPTERLRAVFCEGMVSASGMFKSINGVLKPTR